MRRHPKLPRVIALVGFPGAQSLDLVGPLEVFSMANRLTGVAHYVTRLACRDGGEILCNSGLRLAGAVRFADLPTGLDTILVGGGDSASVQAAAASILPAWLAARAADTRRIGSVCSGAFVLAASSLLDGRRATTHWDFCTALHDFRPAVRLEPDAIFVADPPIYTSAGVTAGFDLCLALVESDLGQDIALAVARNLVLYMRRPGGQTQYSAALQARPPVAPRLTRLLEAVDADPAAHWDLFALAERAAMSPRSLSRIFQKETRMTPAVFVTTVRLQRAQGLLEEAEWPLARVAERAGFGTLAQFHRAFQKQLGTTPAEYRQRFGRKADLAR
ncbi:MAG TPA: helix-turn-helix domain-containing protein [Acetobacteraceae bacterium]|nr:helix-turn-helix domain-containing protein [Acetobacteraceae bacterium]